MDEHGERIQTTVIAVGNQKGGVAKTTNTVHLAAALGELGRECLIIDLDMNQGATRHLGIPSEAFLGAYEMLIGEERAEDVIITNEDEGVELPTNVHLISARRNLEKVEQALLQTEQVPHHPGRAHRAAQEPRREVRLHLPRHRPERDDPDRRRLQGRQMVHPLGDARPVRHLRPHRRPPRHPGRPAAREPGLCGFSGSCSPASTGGGRGSRRPSSSTSRRSSPSTAARRPSSRRPSAARPSCPRPRRSARPSSRRTRPTRSPSSTGRSPSRLRSGPGVPYRRSDAVPRPGRRRSRSGGRCQWLSEFHRSWRDSTRSRHLSPAPCSSPRPTCTGRPPRPRRSPRHPPRPPPRGRGS